MAKRSSTNQISSISLETGKPLGKLIEHPPILDLPEGFDEHPTRYEVWAIQVPVSCDVKELFNDKELNFVSQNSVNRSHALISHNGECMALVEGDAATVESLRILRPSKPSADGDVKVSPSQCIDRLFQLVEDSSVVKDALVNSTLDLESELAPHPDLAKPIAVQVHNFRRAYAPVPPKINLKRKIHTPGSKYIPPVPTTTKTQVIIKQETKPSESPRRKSNKN